MICYVIKYCTYLTSSFTEGAPWLNREVIHFRKNVQQFFI